MSEREPSEPTRSRRGNRMLACCGAVVGVPIAAVVTLWAIASIHNRRPEFAIPSPAMPIPNAYDDFVRAGSMARAMQHKSPYSTAGPPSQVQTFANFAACAKDMQPAQAVLRRALSEPCRHPPVRSVWDISVMFPKEALLREMARGLASEAEYYRMAGQPARAADTLLDGMEMGVMAPRGGGLMPLLVGIAVESISSKPLETLLPALAPGELRHVAQRLQVIQAKRVPYSEYLTDEKWTSAAIAREILRDPKQTASVAESMKNLLELQGLPATGSDRWEAVRFLFADKAAMVAETMRYYDALGQECRGPFKLHSAVKPPDNPFAMGGDTLFIAWRKELAADAITDLLRVELALYLYRAEHGRFPASLSALVPAYLASVPVDPFSGAARQSFRYRLTSKAFLLYSVGPNMRDEGGMPARYPSDSPGDIVAGRIWPARKLP